MVKSIIGDIVDDEKKRKRLALKRKRERERKKRELERQKRERELEQERLKEEKERLERERQELERKKLEDKKKDKVPVYKHKIEESLQAQQSPQSGHDSLPVGFISEPKPQATKDEPYDQPPQEPRAQPEAPAQQPPPFPVGEVRPAQPAAPSPPQQPPDTMANIRELIDTGTKEDLHNYIQKAIRNSQIIYLPGINQSKCKFSDYGYRNLIEHLIESKDFLRIIIDTEDMQGVTFVTLSNLVRPKDDPADANDDKVIPAELTLRGLEGLCEALYSETAELDPYENEWKHLNNLLGCFAQPDIKGKVRLWKLETEKTKIKLTAVNKGDTWIYRVIRGKS
ncbi:MAG: hypothetical protein KAJ51_17885 [Thermoplasmata archaeon]|nr:hypothetical protein [Thermoplasmata archaeon]